MFSIDCERFILEYPKEVTDWDIQILISVVLTQEHQDLLFSNLGLYRKTIQWESGFIPSAENFLKKGFWKVTPKVPSARRASKAYLTDDEIACIEAEAKEQLARERRMA